MIKNLIGTSVLVTDIIQPNKELAEKLQRMMYDSITTCKDCYRLFKVSNQCQIQFPMPTRNPLKRRKLDIVELQHFGSTFRNDDCVIHKLLKNLFE